MNLTLNTSSMVAAIGYVMPACKKSTLPILENILIRPEGDRLKLTASTTEIELSATLDAQWSEQASITVEGKKLADIFKSLPKNETATISLSKDKLIVKQGRSRFSLKTLPAMDFPEFRHDDESTEITMNGAELSDAMGRVSPSMAVNDVRYYLNGMHFAQSAAGVDVVATDGHRLSTCVINSDKPLDSSFILPADAVRPVMALIDQDNITFKVSSNSLCASNKGRTVTVKLIDGKYPDYTRVIPRNNEITAEFNRDELVSAISRVKLLSSAVNKGVSLAMSASGCVITGRNSDQEQAEDSIPCALAGTNELEIGFNADYMLDALGSVNTESIVIKFGSASTGAVIESGGFTGVVLPYRM